MDRWSSFVAESWENTSSTSTPETVSGVNMPFNSHTKSVTLSAGSGKGTESNLWFEETICEVASLFALEKLALEWNQSAPYANWKPYAVEFKNTLTNASLNIDCPKAMLSSNGTRNMPRPSKPKRMTEESNTRMATALLPLFRKAQ